MERRTRESGPVWSFAPLPLRFEDREEAAHALVYRLRGFRGQHPLVLAVPRGGVPMARIVADGLDGELDVVLVHKLGAPGNPEFAIGAIGEDGRVELTRYGWSVVDATHVTAEAELQLAELRLRRAHYTPSRTPIDPHDRVVIVVDDGVATGATLHLALSLVRQRGPRRLVAAVAVGAPEALDLLRTVADEVVCLHAPVAFLAVGEFFRSFRQVSDEEVIASLRSLPAEPVLAGSER